jgi:pimeloyl-ACP methyl ester carboxylesterase
LLILGLVDLLIACPINKSVHQQVNKRKLRQTPQAPAGRSGYKFPMLTGLIVLFIVAGAMVVFIGSALLAHRLMYPPRRSAGECLARGMPIDPSDINAPYESHTAPTPAGKQDVWLIEGLNPGGPAVVVLHGWADSRLGSLGFLTVLRPTASQIALYDRCGHGDAAGHCTWGEAEANEALAIARWLSERRGGGTVVLAGYSMGAVIALEAAVKEPPLVHAVIADSPYRFPKDVIGRVLGHRGIPRWPMLPLAMWVVSRRSPTIRDVDAARFAAGVQCPVLLIHGEADHIVPLEHVQAIADACGHTCRFEVFDDADHLQAACVDPARYMRVVREFLLPGQ